MASLLPTGTIFPNFLIDRFMPELSGDEWKILSYMVRHTFARDSLPFPDPHEICFDLDDFLECGLSERQTYACAMNMVHKNIIRSEQLADGSLTFYLDVEGE